MKRLLGVTAVVVLVSALLSVVVCEGAGPGRQPLRGTWSGAHYAVGGLCTDTELGEGFQSVVIGKGVSSVFGESDFVSVTCNFFASPTTITGSGWMIVTTANRDTVHLGVTGMTDLTTGAWTEYEDILGGTGRFENARGEGVTEGEFVLPPPYSFPYDYGIEPSLMEAPAFWVATTEGWITFE